MIHHYQHQWNKLIEMEAHEMEMERQMREILAQQELEKHPVNSKASSELTVSPPVENESIQLSSETLNEE